MTVVPLPASPCVRVRLQYAQEDGFDGGNRFYLSYSGSAPTGDNCATLASDIASEWGSSIAGLVHESWSLVEVDVLDIATDSGFSGQWSGDTAGTLGGTACPAQCAMNVEFDIARRYRGGKPRMFLPPGNTSDLADPSHWTDEQIAATNETMGDFFAAIAGYSIGAMGTLAHVNLSYFKGFTNIANSSGRERAVPTYRAEALLDLVTGYSAKAVIGSQKRRRTATTP
jgi:hypothetical protein